MRALRRPGARRVSMRAWPEGGSRCTSCSTALATVWLDDVALAALDPDGLSFFNLNTPDDLRRAEELARRAP